MHQIGEAEFDSPRGLPTSIAAYHGAATGLRDVWVAVEAAIEGVVDHKTLAELSVQSIRN